MTNRDWLLDDRLHFGVGIEDTFVPQEGIGRRRLDEYELMQHYENWREDLDLAVEAGAEFIRWGIPWYLVEAQPGNFDWRWLDDVSAHMQKIGLRCVVDLMHYGTPLWLDNQFLNAAYPERVASYARAVAERYAGVWDDFTPLNEPVINAIYCGEDSTWPPYLTGHDGFSKVIVAIARGMVRTQQEIASVNPAARFVHVDAGFRWDGDGGPPSRKLLEERRFISLDLITGRIVPGHPIHHYLTENGTAQTELEWFQANAVTPHFVGVNYYPGFTTVRHRPDGSTEPVEAGTSGLRDLVELYWNRYRLPILITETSRGGDVASRLEWLDQSLAEVDSLRAEGVPVVGYTWFPFFTLVDWLYRHDAKPADEWFVHMGLLDVVRGADRRLHREKTAVFDSFQKAVIAHR